MMKNNQIVLMAIAFVFPIILSNCGTSQGYTGPQKPKSQLATVKILNTKGGSGMFGKYTESPLVTKVDDKVVGSFAKGYPKQVYMLPGKRKITTEYHTTSPQFKRGLWTIAGGVLTGGVGGVAGAAIDRSVNKDFIISTTRQTDIHVQAGKTYYLKAKSKDGRGTGLRVWVVDSQTGENNSSPQQ